MTDFLVKRDDLREWRLADSSPPDLGEGQALLRIDTFGLTANNITYAVFGETMSYWDFFPAEDKRWGRMPVWGFAEVERSRVEGVEEGTRLHGYLPPSSRLVVTPAGVDGAGFVDASPHRADLSSAYQRYVAAGSDPFYRPDTEEMQMLLRPLFFTSFLIDDQLVDDGLAARGPIVASSASSKTAIAAAFLLRRREGASLIGLTSARNRQFVEGLGLYDRVVPYEEVASLDREAATFVDFAGNASVRRAVHSRFQDDLEQSVAVGVTHRQPPPAAESELPGPRPTFFFAPDRVAKRSKDWGRGELGKRVAGAWHPFCEWAGGWLKPIRETGFQALGEAYLEVLDGKVPPSRAHVIALG